MRKIQVENIDEWLYRSTIEAQRSISYIGKTYIAAWTLLEDITIPIPDADMKNNTPKALT